MFSQSVYRWTLQIGSSCRTGNRLFAVHPKCIGLVVAADVLQRYLYMGMDQYLLIPFLGGWTSIYQLFWCSPGVQGFDTLPYIAPPVTSKSGSRRHSSRCFFQEKEGVTDELKSSVDFWFGSLGKTLYTLLLSILGGVSWHLVCSELRWEGPAGVWKHPHQDIGLPRRSAHARRPSVRNWHPVRRFVALLHHVHHFFGLERPTLSQGFRKGPQKRTSGKRQACFSFEQECAKTPHAEHFLEYSSGSSICKDAQSSSPLEWARKARLRTLPPMCLDVVRPYYEDMHRAFPRVGTPAIE